MSKMTMRKRISLTLVTALTTGALTVIASPVASAHSTTVSTGATNTTPSGTFNNSMFTATKLSTSGAVTLVTDDTGAGLTNGTSIGLLTKDSSSGTAQTATMLTSGQLGLYVPTNAATLISFVASAGTFNTSPSAIPSATYSQDRRTALLGTSSSDSASTVAIAWTAPSTAGTYTISMYNGASGTVSLDTPKRTLGAQMTVTVVATSAGGSYSAAYSFCRAVNTGEALATDNIDSSGAATTNGNAMYINFDLNDAYNNNLDAGNIVATATNGALLAFADGAAVAAGTASTVVAYDDGARNAIRVDQPTAGAPLGTTVTITYNGTTVCTKTVGIAGEVAKVTVNVVATQDLSGSSGKADFLEDGWAPSSPRAGHFTVITTDAAGNVVAPNPSGTSTVGTFAVNAASLAGQTIVSTLSVTQSATVTSSTSAGRLSVGTYTCGSTAGEVKTAKIDYTNTSSGKVITSDAFTLRCADDPATYTASWDKASYVQGELATLTVKFSDSKGNPANSTSSTGTWTGVFPMLTAVSATGAAGGLDKNGVKTFTFSVGTTTGVSAGSYVSIIDYGTLTGAGADKATPSYKITTGGDTTTNADVLKSIVALIASINKQIQALQKLILKR